MTNKLSMERAIEALYTVRAYYASLTAGYPKGKDCRGIGDVMCSEIANSCLMAIKALERAQGEWINDSKEDSYYANCSHCGYQIDTHYERGYLNYCPNCGAKMEVEE